jgi:predicted PurR-regulated permease PerM
VAAACNFIPYVGFVIGLVPPVLIAVLDGNWELALLIVVVYVVLNSIATTLVPAKVIGDVVGLAMWATVVSLVFWAWVLGPIGSVLAVPCTLLVKAVLIDADSRAAFLAPVVQSARRNGRAQV